VGQHCYSVRGVLAVTEICPHFVRKSKKGKAWHLGWNRMMDRCSGFKDSVDSTEDEIDVNAGLNCMPSNVIYGHSAHRGVDIHRWSFGLDSGCVSVIYFT
jgi:hypothetical protein